MRIASPFCSRFSFNTQPPKGGWETFACLQNTPPVSTHSRLKAAGVMPSGPVVPPKVSTHSRLKAAGIPKSETVYYNKVSTHSRLKAAG